MWFHLPKAKPRREGGTSFSDTLDELYPETRNAFVFSGEKWLGMATKKFTNLSIYRQPEAKEILVEDGVIKSIGCRLPPADQEIDLDGRLVSPPYVDSHLHLDYVGTGRDDAAADNLSGTLFEGIERWSHIKKTQTVEDVKQRAIRGITEEMAHGVQYIRTHVDAFAQLHRPAHFVRSFGALGGQPRDQFALAIARPQRLHNLVPHQCLWEVSAHMRVQAGRLSISRGIDKRAAACRRGPRVGSGSAGAIATTGEGYKGERG